MSKKIAKGVLIAFVIIFLGIVMVSLSGDADIRAIGLGIISAGMVAFFQAIYIPIIMGE
jgi:drug/metabolite transporter (DMT)-like permease